MKTIVAAVSSAMIFLATLSSCSTCTICEKGSEPDVRICKQDYANDQQYRQAIIDKEAALYSCHN